MSTRDPAVLFYIDTWLTATAEMDSDVRGWYLNLILHQFDKKSLPNELEKLASLAGVRFSEFERFKQVFYQVLKQKFKENENGRLENDYAKTILQAREQFKDKRSKSGNVGVIIKIAKEIGFSETEISELKSTLYLLETNEIEKYKDKQMLKHLLEQMRKLYINKDKDKSIDYNKLTPKKEFNFKNSLLEFVNDEQVVNDYMEVRKKKKGANTETAFNLLMDKINESNMTPIDCIKKCIERNWLSFDIEWLNKSNNNKPANNGKSQKIGGIDIETLKRNHATIEQFKRKEQDSGNNDW